MIPLNNYQRTLYEILNKTNYKVYDEVPKDEEPPVISISDYTIADGDYKNRGYIINQKIDIYSLYEGKKEINTMVSDVLKELKLALNISVDDTFFIADIKLLESSVSRMEDGLYIANLNILFELEEI